MEVNNEVANGVKISGDDFEFVMAVRKPNADVTITREFWFKGKANKLKEVKQNV